MVRDINNLLGGFAAVIKKMPDEFSGHDFIRELMYEQQKSFIDALKLYADTKKPFQHLHARLARSLHKHADQITYNGHAKSTNVFGHMTDCSLWKKGKAAPVGDMAAQPDDPDLLDEDKH